MNFSFSFAWLFGGLALVVAGALIVKYYDKIADNFASGVASYNHVKLAGVIAVGIGFAAATNLVPLILAFVAQTIFGSVEQ